jgi:putative flippase GtrA
MSMARGAFWVFGTPENDPQDICFQVAEDFSGDIPLDQLALRDDIDAVLATLKAAFETDGRRFAHYFKPLLSLAQAGLVGEDAQPEVGKRALAALRKEIVAKEAGKIKNRYMRRLGVVALWYALPALAAGVVLRWLAPATWLIPYLSLWIGAMVGAWLSFAIRKQTFSFEDIAQPEKDLLEPGLRLMVTGAMTLILGLAFSLGMLQISIGGVSTADIATKNEVALLVGMLCGISEQALPATLNDQANKLLRPER